MSSAEVMLPKLRQFWAQVKFLFLPRSPHFYIFRQCNIIQRELAES